MKTTLKKQTEDMVGKYKSLANEFIGKYVSEGDLFKVDPEGLALAGKLLNLMDEAFDLSINMAEQLDRIGDIDLKISAILAILETRKES